MVLVESFPYLITNMEIWLFSNAICFNSKHGKQWQQIIVVINLLTNKVDEQSRTLLTIFDIPKYIHNSLSKPYKRKILKCHSSSK